MALPEWRDPKLNVMGEHFDYQMMLMVKHSGWPAQKFISRSDGNFKDDDYIHLNIGGEGYKEVSGICTGFNGAINVNTEEKGSIEPRFNIPHLVLMSGDWTKYPFENGFADYITKQGESLTDKDVQEISRCIRPGGEIGLWLNQISPYIDQLAAKLETFPEYNAWDEFQGKSCQTKTRISVPGQNHTIAYSKSNSSYLIQPVSSSGKFGAVTERGKWEIDDITVLKIRGKSYLYSSNNSDKSYSIKKLLPGGYVGATIDNGNLSRSYALAKTAQIDGKMYLLRYSRAEETLNFTILLDSGHFGSETSITEVVYDQFIPFNLDAQAYAFTFNADSKEWTITKLQIDGLVQTDSGFFPIAYNIVVVNVKENPILFGLGVFPDHKEYSWFLRRIGAGGKLEEENNKGLWKDPYATLSAFNHGNRGFIFAQDSERSLKWSIHEVLEGGKMGGTTNFGKYKFAYSSVAFYTQFR